MNLFCIACKNELFRIMFILINITKQVRLFFRQQVCLLEEEMAANSSCSILQETPNVLSNGGNPSDDPPPPPLPYSPFPRVFGPFES